MFCVAQPMPSSSQPRTVVTVCDRMNDGYPVIPDGSGHSQRATSHLPRVVGGTSRTHLDYKDITMREGVSAFDHGIELEGATREECGDRPNARRIARAISQCLELVG